MTTIFARKDQQTMAYARRRKYNNTKGREPTTRPDTGDIDLSQRPAIEILVNESSMLNCHHVLLSKELIKLHHAPP